MSKAANLLNDKQLVNNVQAYLQANARSLDIALFAFHFRHGAVQSVLTALKQYQNADGGYGHALEPDVRLPNSTAIATWRAFQIMNEVGVRRDERMLQLGLQYLINTYDEARIGWPIVGSEVNLYPHAPWWGYETALAGFGWGNPSAELLGFLIKYGDSRTADLVQALTRQALIRVKVVEPDQFHEVFTFKALYNFADRELRQQLKSPLERLIINAANTNPAEWHNYVATPLRFIDSPNDPFAHLFGAPLLRQNLDFVIATLVDGNRWEPNWDWGGAYPSDWMLARKEWSGELTVKNLLMLKNFETF